MTLLINELKNQLNTQKEENLAKDEEYQIHNFDKGDYEFDLPAKTTLFPR